GYRRMVYLGSEDNSGYRKGFLHGAAPILSGGSVVDGRYHWEHIYYAPYTPTKLTNTFTSPYPAVVGALRAQSDAYWYDAASRYRTWVEGSSGMSGLTTTRSNT